MLDSKKADVSAWSETAVMQSQIFSLRKQAFSNGSIIFSSPALQRQSMHVGNATGTALYAKRPIHCMSEEITKGNLFCTGRYLFSILTLPDNTSFRVIVVYGFTGKTAQAKQNNQLLFQEIFTIYKSLRRIPTFLMGDFNFSSQDFGTMHIDHNEWIDVVRNFFPNNDVCTFMSNCNTTSCIDHVLCNDLALRYVSAVEVEPLVRQGHAGIILTMNAYGLPEVFKSPQNGYNTAELEHIRSKVLRSNQWEEAERQLAAIDVLSPSFDHNLALEHLQDIAAQGLKAAYNEHSQSKLKVCKRGTHHFIPVKEQFSISSSYETSTCSKQDNDLLNIIAKQQRRFDSIISLIQRGQSILADQTIHKLLSQAFKNQPFQIWMSSALGLVHAPTEHHLDLNTWIYRKHAFDEWASKHIKCLRQKIFKLHNRNMQDDWAAGGSKHFRLLKSNVAEPYISAYVECFQITQVNLVKLRHVRKTPTVNYLVPQINFSPIFVQDGRTLSFIRKSDNRFEFSAKQLDTTRPISVCCYTTNGTDLANAFAQQWKAVWCRPIAYDSLQLEDFVAKILPLFEIPAPLTLNISIASWFDSINKLANKTARGPDGWTPLELKAIPASFHFKLVSILNSMLQQGICFASHTSVAVVTTIPKKQAAASLLDYRPISLFPVMHRLWSSVVYQQFIVWMQTWLDPSILGFLPGKGVTTLSTEIALLAERAAKTSSSLNGVIIDIKKCFDSLQWSQFFTLLPRLGVPETFIRIWAQLQKDNRKYFRINQCLSSPLHAENGYGQGDCISILPLLFLGHAFAVHLRKCFPSMSPYIYADNFSLITTVVADVLPIFQEAIQFLQQWDLSVDLSKSIVWGALPNDREQLKQSFKIEFSQVLVLSHCKDLGSHLIFDRAYHAATTNERKQNALSTLNQIRTHNISQDVRARIIKQATYPKIFFNPLLHFYSSDFLTEISRTVSRILDLDFQHRSLMHSLTIFGPDMDPFYYVHYNRIREAFKFLQANPKAVEYFLEQNMHKTGPVSLFRQSLEFFGLKLDEQFLFEDSLPFHRCSFEFVKYRINQQWQTKLTDYARIKRNLDFQGTIDLCSTMSALKHLDYKDTVLARSFLTFRNCTGQAKKHFKPHLQACQHCGQEDTWHHRLHNCQYVKQRSTEAHLIPNIPIQNFTKNFIWHTCPDHIFEVHQYLQSIPEAKPEPQFSGRQTFFVDGSCSTGPTQYRLASGALFNPQTGYSHQFILPGLLQSSVRAEAYAFYLAMKASTAADIFTDCSYVHSTFSKMQQDINFQPTTHIDIWKRIKTILLSKGPNNFRSFKVKSHVLDGHRASNQPYSWSWANHIVDVHAKIANCSRPQQIFRLLELSLQHSKKQNTHSRAIISHILQTYRLTEKDIEVPEHGHPQNPAITPQSSPVDEIGPLIFLKCTLPKTDDLFPKFAWGPRWGGYLLQYLSKLQWPANDSTVNTVGFCTLYDIFLDFYFSTGVIPPQLVKTGRNHSERTLIWPNTNDLHSPTITQHNVLFGDSVLSLSRIHGFEVIPGLLEHRKQLFLQIGSSQLFSTRCPAPKLLSLDKVQLWKQQQVHIHQHVSHIVNQKLPSITGPCKLQLEHHDDSDFVFMHWFNRSKNNERIRRANNEGQGNNRIKTFEKAKLEETNFIVPST
jgi:hypothetical protein